MNKKEVIPTHIKAKKGLLDKNNLPQEILAFHSKCSHYPCWCNALLVLEFLYQQTYLDNMEHYDLQQWDMFHF